jgi:hypothetical protein
MSKLKFQSVFAVENGEHLAVYLAIGLKNFNSEPEALGLIGEPRAQAGRAGVTVSLGNAPFPSCKLFISRRTYYSVLIRIFNAYSR